MIMDRIRSCYVAKMKLWADRDTLTEVRWFFADPEAKVYPGPHAFGSWWTWDRTDHPTAPGVGEKSYVRYDKGANPLQYKGKKACGSADAFREGGVAGRDPVVNTDAQGNSPCCGVQQMCGGFPLPPALLATGMDILPWFEGECACFDGIAPTMSYIGESELLPGWHEWQSAVTPTNRCVMNNPDEEPVEDIALDYRLLVPPAGLPLPCPLAQFGLRSWRRAYGSSDPWVPIGAGTFAECRHVTWSPFLMEIHLSTAGLVVPDPEFGVGFVGDRPPNTQTCWWSNVWRSAVKITVAPA